MNHRVASAGKTVEYRLSNQLTPDVKNMIGITGDPTRADYGFGPGLAVRTTAGIVRMRVSFQCVPPMLRPVATGAGYP
jgi:hypothetical protein